MDAQIGRVVAALDRKNLRDNTLIVFMSDNGGTRNAMFTGAIADVSKIKIPCDNGPYREGKGTLYEGGMRVVAFVNWPGHIKAGSRVDELIHVVDLYPSLVGLAGGTLDKAKRLDGKDVWQTISGGQPSPRTEIVYNVEPFRAAVRQGDWKLIWRTTLPSAVEMYDIATDPSEKNNVAAEHPDKVAALQERANELAATMAKPLFLETEFQALRQRAALPPPLPNEYLQFGEKP
jgi:arylsulfatase A-like enzyme